MGDTVKDREKEEREKRERRNGDALTRLPWYAPAYSCVIAGTSQGSPRTLNVPHEHPGDAETFLVGVKDQSFTP
jgi:hypothetical protein